MTDYAINLPGSLLSDKNGLSQLVEVVLNQILDVPASEQVGAGFGGKKWQGFIGNADSYSLADMAAYPWIVPHQKQGRKIAEFPNLAHWFETVRNRPAVKKAYARAEAINSGSLSARAILFGQGRARSGGAKNNLDVRKH